MCSVNISIPSEWFQHSEPAASVAVQVRLLNSFNQQSLGNIRVNSQPALSFTNDVGFQVPSRPLHRSDVFSVPVFGHATYAVAAYGIKCQVGSDLAIEDSVVDNSMWIAEVRPLIISGANEIGIAAILRSPESAVEAVIEEPQLLFSLQIRVLQSAELGMSENINCTTSYLSNIYNEKIQPRGLVAPVPSLAAGSFTRPGSDQVRITADVPRGLFSFADQSQVVNTAVLTGDSVSVPITHNVIMSSGTIASNLTVQCNTTSVSFSVSSECNRYTLYGNETLGAQRDSILTNYLGLTSELFVRVWYPLSQASLQSTASVIRPVTQWESLNESSQCVQQYQPASLSVFVDFSYGFDSPIKRVSVLSHVAPLIRSSNPNVVRVSEDGTTLLGLSPGTSIISAGPYTIPLSVRVLSEPLNVTSLDITLFSGLNLNLVEGPYNILSSQTATVSVEQRFDSISSNIFLSILALLDDGSNVLLNQTTENIQLRPVLPHIASISGGNISLLAGGTGDLIEVTWLSPCTGLPIAISNGSAAVTIPDPVSFEIQQSTNRITYPRDISTIGGIPTSLTLTVALVFPDGLQRDVTSDPQTTYLLRQGAALVNLSHSDAGLSVIPSDIIGDSFGRVEIVATFGRFTISSRVFVDVVRYLSLRLSSTPYPPYPGSNTISKDTLFQIESTGQYQQVALILEAILSDGTSANVTQSNLAFYQAPSQAVAISGNVLSVTAAGSYRIEGHLGSDVSSLTLNAVNESVFITSFDNFSIPAIADTFSGIRGSSTSLKLDVTFSDSTRYLSFIPLARNIFPRILSLTGNTPSAISVNPLTGQITLQGNYHSLVTVTVATTGINFIRSSLSFACNLLPGIGDVDLGQPQGIPIPEVALSSNFSVPLVINSGTLPFTVSFTITYTNLRFVSVSRNSSWSGDLQSTTDMSGFIHITATTSNESTGLVYVAVLGFQASTAGLGSINGVITQASLGTTVPRPIFAGQVEISIMSTRQRRSIGLEELSFHRNRRNTDCSSAPFSSCLGVRQTGDTNGDCIFTFADVEFLMKYLTEGLFDFTLDSGALLHSSLLSTQVVEFDVDLNSVQDFQDAYFLHQVQSGLLNFLKSVTVSPIQDAMNCQLSMNATFLGRGDSVPDDSSTEVYFDIGLAFDSSFTSQRLFDESNLVQGSLVSTISKGPALPGGIIRAEPLGSGVFGVTMETNLTVHGIGLSIIQVTSPMGVGSVQARTKGMFGSPDPPYTYSSPLLLSFPVFSNFVQVRASQGYSPFTSFNNTMTTLTCITPPPPPVIQETLIQVSIPENVSIGSQVLTVSAQSQSDLPVAYSITSGNTGGVFDIGTSDGVVRVVRSLDFESNTNYTLLITATDTATGFTATATGEVTISDINDNPPVFTIPGNISIPANTPVMAFIITAIAVQDADEGSNAEVSLSIEPGDTFAIDASRGSVTLRQPLNFDQQNIYIVTITARDMGSPSLSSSSILNITILPPDPTVLQFNSSIYRTTVIENSPDGTFVIQILAMPVVDPVTDTPMRIEYTLNTPGVPFSLGYLTGELVVNGTIDREVNSSYELQITATILGAVRSIPALAVVMITIGDLNDNPPVFSAMQYRATIAEDGTLTNELITVSASDPDEGNNGIVVYSLLGDSLGFTINATSGLISSTMSLNYEDAPVIQFEVIATDLGSPQLSAISDIVITITDVNDNPPEISILPETAAVSESLQIGTVIAMIEVTDADSPSTNGIIDLSVIDSTTNTNPENFAITSLSSNTTGGNGSLIALLTLTSTLDYESQRLYSFIIIASDNGIPPMSSNTTYTVNVTDVNDNPPIFSQPKYNFNVSEDIIVPSTLATLTALDADEGSNAVVEFFLNGSTPSTSQFNISASGVLVVVDNLDYEQVQMYVLTVGVRNTASGTFTGTASICIEVINVNEFAPNFTQNIYQASFLEETQGAFVIQVMAIDLDLNDSVVYSVDDGNFIIDMNGIIRTTNPIDREIIDSYNFSVIATDGITTGSFSSTAMVIATVQDINDNRPVFDPFKNISILQSTEIGRVITTFSASDADADLNGEIGRFVLDPEFPEFSISPDGQLRVASSLSASSTAEYILNVLVYDQGIPPQNNSAIFSIQIQQLPVPIFQQSQYNASVLEGNHTSTFLVQVEAFTLNPEATIVSYQLQTASLSDLFTVDRNSGNVTAVGHLDREIADMYNVEVLAVSSLGASLYNSTTMVIVSVLDVNDNPPIFNISSLSVSVNETLPLGSVVATFLAFDVDVGSNAIIEYSITSGNEILQLTINSRGIVVAPQSLIDKTGQYRITVTAANPNETAAFSTTSILTVDVFPVNTFAPVFDMTSYSADVFEDISLNAQVIMLNASDPDLGSAGTVSYSIIDILGFYESFIPETFPQQVNAENVFVIDNSTGSITVQKLLDYENATTFTITVLARDNGIPQRSSTVTVNLRVIDVNDNPPVFTQTVYSGSVNENAPAGQAILNVAVTDEDSAANSAVTYDIVSSSIGNAFRLTSAGELQTTMPLDREVHNMASLVIMASNSGSNRTLTATSTIEIVINDINDNPPVFDQAEYFRTLQAPVLENSTILQVVATDGDATANNSRIQFRLENLNTEFMIDANLGIIVVTADIITEKNISLIVIAFDNGIPVLSEQTQVTVFILAPNDLTVNRERDIIFSTTGDVYLFNSPIELTPTMYQQMYGFPVSPDLIQLNHRVTAQLGPLISTLTITSTLLPAVSARAALAYNEIWPDQPQISFTLQARDRYGNVQVSSTSVIVQASHPELGTVTGSCLTRSSNGVCQVSLNVPSTWFENDANVTTSFGLSQSSLQMVGIIQLRSRPSFASSLTSYVYMAMPLRPLFIGDTFLVPVYGRTGSRGVGSYTTTVVGSSEVDLVTLSFDSSLWVAEIQRGSSNSISITAVLSDQTTEPTPGETLLFTISARVSLQSQEDALILSALTVEIRELNDFNRVRLLPPSGLSSISGFAVSRNGITTSGAIYVASDPIVDILPYAERAQLINTAVINGVAVSEPIVVIGLHRSGRVAIISDSSGLSCTSDAVSVVSVNLDCSNIILSASQTQASAFTAINVLYNGISASFLTQIWIPASIDLFVADKTLQLLATVLDTASNCTPTVQSTHVRGYANITNGDETIVGIDVTHLIQPISSNSNVVDVSGSNLIGISPGTAIISGQPVNGDVSFNMVVVSVVSESVELIGLDVRVLTDLLFTGPLVIQPLVTHSSVLTDEQAFDFEGTLGYAITSAVFSDGTRLVLNDSEVMYSTMYPNVVGIAGSSVMALASGAGNLVQATWRLPEQCGGQTLQTGSAFVSVNIPRPSSIVAQLSESVLALSQSTANLIGVSTTAVLTVTARYNDGRIQILTLDNRTQYSVPPNIDLFRNSDSLVASTNSNATLTGDYSIQVTFLQFPDITIHVNYSIVSVEDILLTANPYPIYPGSHLRNVQQLSVLGTTSALQQAVIIVAASLTNGASINVTSNLQLVLTVTGSSQELQNSVSISNGPVANILSVSSLVSGTLSISARLREVSSRNPIVITVVLTPVHLTAITIVPFPSNTFRGSAGINSRQVVISVTFNDTTQYPNLFQDFFLTNLVTFEASPSSALVIDSQSGLATLQGNSITQAMITVRALPPASVTASIDVACNLDPEFGDIDLGSLSGLPVPPVANGSLFSVEVRVNSGTTTLDSIEVDVAFDPNIITAISANEGRDWPSTGQFAFTVDDPSNLITVGGTLVSSTPVQGIALHLATINFMAVQPGSTNITGVIHTLARRVNDGEVATNIGTVPRNFVAGSVQVLVSSSRQRRSISTSNAFNFKNTVRTRRQAMTTCSSQRETGDVDGNCVFDVRDVSFLQIYYLSTIVTGVQPSIPEDRRIFLDADLNGEVNANDVVFLLRVNFRLLRFASGLTFLPVLLTNEDCMLEINITLLNRGDVPADSSTSVLLFDIASENPGFQAMFDVSLITVGRVVTTNKGPGLYGGLIEASYYGGGVYGITMDSSLGQAPFGISPIQVTFNADNMTASFRTAAMFSQGVPRYNSIDANIVLRGQAVSVSTQLGYSPLLLANTSLDTRTCLRLRSALVFQQVSYTAMVSERAIVGISIVTVTANSTRPSPTIIYSIITPGSPFSINSASGIITVSQPLDYETVSIYNFTAMASETTTNGEVFTDTAQVTVFIINVNDIPPSITQPPLVSVLASVPSGDQVYQVEATDPDNLDSLSYAIEASNLFFIDPTTGTVRVARELLGAANSNVTVTVRVLDSIFSSTTQLIFDVYLPEFSQSSYLVNVSEAAILSSRVAELTIDNARNENFNFSLQSVSFSINESGIIVVSAALDFETQSTYVLNVVATALSIQIQTTVFISLMDINDNAPMFLKSSFNATISMSSFLGTEVAQLVALDQDSPGPNSDVSYSISPSNNSNLFRISEFNGRVIVAQTLFQGPSVVILIIVATDNGFPAMSSSTNLTIEILPTGLRTFAIPPSVLAFRTALVMSTPVRANNAFSNSTTFLQMYTKLTAVDNGQLSASFLGSSKTSTAELSTIRQSASSTVANVLHPTRDVYQESRDIVLAFQVRDDNHFTGVVNTSIQRQVTNSIQTTLTTDPCTVTAGSGVCVTRLTIPEDWFATSSSIVVGNTLLNGVPVPTASDTLNLVTTPILSQSITSNILVEVPSRDIVSGTAFTIDVYGYSSFYITGFSIVFETQGPISIANLIIDNTQWNVLTNSNRTHYGITSILTTPGNADTNRDGNRMFLFTLSISTEAGLSSTATAIIKANIQSLSDVIESSLILDSSSSTSGPALVLSRSGLGNNGTVTVVPNSIQAIYPYVQQSEILNTALLTGSNVNVPVQVFVGYASGEVLLYTQSSITCSSSEPLVINPDATCSFLALTLDETVGSNSVMITYTIGTMSGSLPVIVYVPTRPLNFVSTDLILNRIQYSNDSSCVSYQQAELSIFTNYETSTKVFANVSVTDIISPLLTTSDASIVELNGTTVLGRGPGEARICVAQRADLGCLTISVSDSVVNVASIVGSLLVEVNLFTPQRTSPSSDDTAEITARSRFLFLQEEGDLVVAVQFSDGAISPVSPNEITVIAPADTGVYSLLGNTLVSTGSGEMIGQFEWTPLGGSCNIIFTDYFLVLSTLPTPIGLQTSLLSSPNVHYMTTTTEIAASLIGLPSSLTISVNLEFPGGRLLDVSRDSRVSYISSSPAVTVSNGIIIASEEAAVQLTVRYTAEVNFTVVIEIQVIVSTGISLNAHPYPIYPGSSNITVTRLSLIESTGVWQRAVLEVQLVLSNGTSVDITTFSQTQFRSITHSLEQAMPEVQIASSPLPVLTVQGGIGVIEIVATFSPHVTSTNISVVNSQVFVSSVGVVPLTQDTLRGIRGGNGQTVSVDLMFTDGTRLLSYPTNPALLGQMISGLVNYTSTDASFTVSNDGVLHPLTNTHMPVSLTVTAASDSSISSEYNFFVNLDPDLGDVDIGMETGSAIPTGGVDSQLSLPVIVNSGTINIGSIDLLLTYDPTIIEPTAVVTGTGFGMGIYESSLNDPPGELRIGAAFSSDVSGTRLHLFTITLQVLGPTSPDGSFFTGTILTLAMRTTDGATIGLLTPRPMVAGNLTFTVEGRSKRASSSDEAAAGQHGGRVHERHRRQIACSAPPCPCSWMTPGDTDGNCVFDVRDVSYALLYISEVLVGGSGPVVSMVTPMQLIQLNPNQDGRIDTSDAFFLLRALFRLLYFLDSVSVTAVQDPLSQCLFSVSVRLASAQELPLRAADVIIDIGFEDASNTIASEDIVTGDFITSEKGAGLNGVLILARQITEDLFSVQLNATFMSDSVGVSLVLVTYDALSATSSSRSVQFFGGAPPMYPSQLSVSLPLRGSQVIVAATSGYSPFRLVSNTLTSDQCSDLPIVGSDLNVTFQSPFQAELSWLLLNLREGLNFSVGLKLQVVACILDQNEEITNCSGLVAQDVQTSSSHTFTTEPFTRYYLQVAGPTSATDNVTAQSPESSPVGLAPPLYSQKPEGTSFTWSPPMQPNGVITHYILYVGPVAVYNGSLTSFSSTITFQDTAEVVVEVYNSAGSTRSQSVLVYPLVGSGPGERTLSLTAEEAIIVSVILTGLIVLILVIILVCGMWRRKMAELARKKPAFLATDFGPENFEVVSMYVCMYVCICVCMYV